MAITRHLFLLFTLLLFTGLSINTYAGPVIVPDVVGMSQADAEQKIVEDGLTVGNVTNEFSGTVPAGDVISQNPAAGTEVDADSPVDLVISDGPALVTVPNVVGDTLSVATGKITAAGLVVGSSTDQASVTVPVDSIISQSPAAGTEVAADSPVDLVISTGVAVPNVTGLNLTDATSALTADGLTVGATSDQSSETVPAGDVISQDPAAGTNVNGGSSVDLVISTGPATVPTTVPNVVGDTLSVATGKITAANLVVGTTTDQSSDTVTAGDVISQSPAASSTANEGDAVDLVISTGPATVPTTVPNVVGDTLSVATGKITAANLVVGTTTDQSSDTVTAGDVISQSPAASSTANEGDAVDLVISTGPATVPTTVPNVVGDTLSVATGKITAANLVVGTTTDQSSDTVTAGDVISQSPAASSTANEGDAVDLVISTGPATVPTTVPNVVGDTLSVATGKITAANLVVGTTTDQSSDTVTAGDVISQSPAAGSSANEGDAVDLVISTGPATVPTTVPNVVGDTLSVATGKITAANLVVGTTTDQSSDSIPAGSVISQSPAAGSSANEGDAVNLVISTGTAGGGDTVVIDGCDTGVQDPGVIQEGIDACELDANNHGQFVRCVAIFTRGLVFQDVITRSERQPIMKCASQSSLGKPGSVTPTSDGQTDGSVITSQNVVIGGLDTGVADSDGSIQASIDACAAGAKNQRKFLRCVSKSVRSLKRSGLINNREKRVIRKSARRSGIGKS